MEDELKAMAHSMRQVRNDYVNGMITDEEFRKVEPQFMDNWQEEKTLLFEGLLLTVREMPWNF
ncbi:MAG: hypothetical protein WCF40_06185 [Desulfobacterales bacterium]|jgi:hypothetical protein